MSAPAFISIDQNSQPLWDAVPKLAALAAAGMTGRHLVEDIDVACTLQGGRPGDTRLELAPECCYRGGGSDWGASLFYTAFLGRQPLDIRKAEPYIGMTLAAASRRLGCTLDELYARHSVSDNLQLVGVSFLDPETHRIMGDLTLAETAPCIRELLDFARTDMLGAFPDKLARERIGAWFAAESGFLESCLLRLAGGRLADLYLEWMRRHAPPGVAIGLSSAQLHARQAGGAEDPAVGLWLREYEAAAAAYNEAVTATGLGLHPLRTQSGELPFFLLRRLPDGRLARGGIRLEGCTLLAAGQSWRLGPERRLPFPEMEQAGAICLAGKALVLPLQARSGSSGGALALPHLGSSYMPAARLLEAKLLEAGLLTEKPQPLLRVRLQFIRHWRGCATLLRLPEYLRVATGMTELTAGEFTEAHESLLQTAAKRLQRLHDPATHPAVVAELFPRQAAAAKALETRRRELAADPAARAAAAAAWDELRGVQTEILTGLLAQVVRDLQVLNLKYADSRGAILPWALALGGPEFYDCVIAGAEIAAEPEQDTQTTARSDLELPQCLREGKMKP